MPSYSALPSYITFSSTTSTFTWQTNNLSYAKSYNISVTAKLNNGMTFNSTFLLTIKNPCLNAYLTINNPNPKSN